MSLLLTVKMQQDGSEGDGSEGDGSEGDGSEGDGCAVSRFFFYLSVTISF